jgi:hypothetical protein
MTEIRLNFKYNENNSFMTCHSDDRIGIVKQRLQDAEGLEPEKIILRYPSNRLLNDEKTLDYYNLNGGNNSTPIEISLKNETRGGGRRRRRRTKRRRTKRKGSKKRSRRTRRRR